MNDIDLGFARQTAGDRDLVVKAAEISVRSVKSDSVKQCSKVMIFLKLLFLMPVTFHLFGFWIVPLTDLTAK